MKARINLFISVGLLAALLAFMPAAVLAHESDEPHDDSSVEMAQTTSVDETESTKPEDINKRVADRKAALKTRLSAAKIARVKSKCKGSQGKLSSIQGRVKGLETSRAQVYENLVNRLNKASEKLAEKNVDVSQLNQQITELNTLIETFNTNLDTYKSAVGDISLMDCVGEPAGFQASLETARTARSETGVSSQAIRTYLKDTIKPTLVELKKQLGSADSTENTESTDSTEDAESSNDQSQDGEN